jgi:hypothetical protein
MAVRKSAEFLPERIQRQYPPSMTMREFGDVIHHVNTMPFNRETKDQL